MSKHLSSLLSEYYLYGSSNGYKPNWDKNFLDQLEQMKKNGKLFYTPGCNNQTKDGRCKGHK